MVVMKLVELVDFERHGGVEFQTSLEPVPSAYAPAAGCCFGRLSALLVTRSAAAAAVAEAAEAVAVLHTISCQPRASAKLPTPPHPCG
jgi:hypothetical protein